MDFFLEYFKNITGLEKYKLSGVFSALICSLGLGLAVALGRLAFEGEQHHFLWRFLGHYYLLLPWEQFVFVWGFHLDSRAAP